MTKDDDDDEDEKGDDEDDWRWLIDDNGDDDDDDDDDDDEDVVVVACCSCSPVIWQTGCNGGNRWQTLRLVICHLRSPTRITAWACFLCLMYQRYAAWFVSRKFSGFICRRCKVFSHYKNRQWLWIITKWYIDNLVEWSDEWKLVFNTDNARYSRQQENANQLHMIIYVPCKLNLDKGWRPVWPLVFLILVTLVLMNHIYAQVQLIKLIRSYKMLGMPLCVPTLIMPLKSRARGIFLW